MMLHIVFNILKQYFVVWDTLNGQETHRLLLIKFKSCQKLCKKIKLCICWCITKVFTRAAQYTVSASIAMCESAIVTLLDMQRSWDYS